MPHRSRNRSGSLVCLVVCCLISALTGASLPAQVPLAEPPIWQSLEQGKYNTGLVWRDANNDGFIDLWISAGNDIVLAPAYMYQSDNGSLPANASWQSIDQEYSGHCAVGDINDDGLPDLVVANYIGTGGFSTQTRPQLYLNSPTGLSTSPDWTPLDSMYSFSCTLGDVDGDGDLDLAMGTGEPYNSIFQPERIYYNIDGELQTLPGWTSSSLTGTLDVAFGDVNNDGYLDLAIGSDDRGAAVYQNLGGTLASTPTWQMANPKHVNTLVWGDVNGDGWLDLVVAHNNQISDEGHFRVFFNNGSGTLNTMAGWESASEGYGAALALYDYDSDGDMDLAAGRWWSKPMVFENTGTTLTTSPVWQGQPNIVAEELAWADVDGMGVENRVDSFYAPTSSLFYMRYNPLQSIDSVLVDGSILGLGNYCYDLFGGWVSLSDTPADSVLVYYTYSFTCDLGLATWDSVNFVFGNTNQPFVQFEADTSIGFVPLEVQFTDNSMGASTWDWDFGDGGTSIFSNPIHTYHAIGAYDVSLVVDLPDGSHNRTIKNMIVALADTLRFDTATIGLDDTVILPVYLTNSQPMHEFILPFVFAGSMNLEFFDYDTDGCRTDDFEQVQLVGYDDIPKKATFKFRPVENGVGDGLSPGSGRLINLHFRRLSGSGANVIDTTTLLNRELELDADYAVYQPRVTAGAIFSGDAICGDMDGDGAGPNIVDLTYLVGYLFNGGPAPVDLNAANVDGDNGINIVDLTYLVAFLFNGGPAPNCP